MIKVFKDGVHIQHKVWKFPSGEIGVKLDTEQFEIMEDCKVAFVVGIQSSDDVMELLLLTDAVRRMVSRNTLLGLVIPYIPYGRQDRVCDNGESFSLKVFTNLINAQKYDYVITYDTHSNVTDALLENLAVVSQLDLFKHAWCKTSLSNNFPDLKNVVIVAPDVGAHKKALSVAEYLGVNDVVYATKVRDVTNGQIKGVTFSGLLGGRDILVVDDICDKGGTFIELGKQLKSKGVSSAHLYVTHGMFNAGTDELLKYYNSIYTTNSYHQDRDGLVDGVTYFSPLE